MIMETNQDKLEAIKKYFTTELKKLQDDGWPEGRARVKSRVKTYNHFHKEHGLQRSDIAYLLYIGLRGRTL